MKSVEGRVIRIDEICGIVREVLAEEFGGMRRVKPLGSRADMSTQRQRKLVIDYLSGRAGDIDEYDASRLVTLLRIHGSIDAAQERFLKAAVDSMATDFCVDDLDLAKARKILGNPPRRR